MTKVSKRLVYLGAWALTAGCGPSPEVIAPQEQALRGTDTFRDFGEYIVYINALTTDQLTPDIAREYGIVRSNRRAMLNVSVHKNEPGAMPTTAVRAAVTSSAINLTGQLRAVSLREIAEGDAIYYIGESDITDGETLIYTIDVVPEGDTELLSFRYQKQFFVSN